MYFLSLLYSFVCFPLHFPLSSLFLVFQVASAILQFSFPCHSTEFPQVSSRPPRLFPPFPHCSRSPRPSLVFHHGCESRLSALPLFLCRLSFFLLYLPHLSSFAPLFLPYALPTHLPRVATPASPLPAFPACLRGWELAPPADMLATAVIFITLGPSRGRLLFTVAALQLLLLQFIIHAQCLMCCSVSGLPLCMSITTGGSPQRFSRIHTPSPPPLPPP